MTDRLIFAVPSKGRLMEQTTEHLTAAGLTLRKATHARGYRGDIDGLPGIDVAYVSAAEIASRLKSGQAHLGITGEDLVREAMDDADTRVDFLKALGFGRADVVVAVPRCWLDARRMADLHEIAPAFRRRHGRRLRIATKFMNLTRHSFKQRGISDYRLVESFGATEAAPAAGTADLIVDITTTGATLAANGLKVLDDGVILQSQAHLFASKAAPWSPVTRRAVEELLARLVSSE